ncbi:MAG: hypothetical protein M1837_002664 [Sclerophora amabilis]|nr:MAG: hypothetical protein M1837_002664 [Sclerophora amabilis]
MSIPSLSPAVSEIHSDLSRINLETPLDVDKLNAADLRPLPSVKNDESLRPQDGLLVVSPYTTRSHLLDLNTLGHTDRLFAQAMTWMQATREDYATAAYVDAFNWAFIVEKLRDLAWAESFAWTTTSFYLIVFRSQSLPSSDRVRLGLLDEMAHEEATASGGLLKYWFGQPDHQFRNLATCAWRSRADALRANTGKKHQRAMLALKEMYGTCALERFELTITNNVEGWSIAQFR